MLLPTELMHLQDYAYSARKIRKGLYAFDIPQWKKDGSLNRDWLSFRNFCLGASACGSVLNLSKWTSAYTLFQNKVDCSIKESKTQLMLCGSVMEKHIVDFWKCFDTYDTWLDNVYNKKLQRKCHNVNGFVVNVDYPYFAISFDRMVYANQVLPMTGEVIEFSYPLEIKNLSAYTKKGTIEPQYLVQMLIQAKVWGSPMVEFFANIGNSQVYIENIDLRDTTDPTVIRLLELQDKIVVKGTEFMKNVFEVKHLKEMEMFCDTEEEVNEIRMKIESLYPQLDGLESTTETLLEDVGEESEEVIATEEQEQELVFNYVNGDFLEKKGKEMKNYAKNLVMKLTNSNGVVKFDGGYTAYKPKSETRSRSHFKFVPPADTEVNANIQSLLDSYEKNKVIV